MVYLLCEVTTGSASAVSRIKQEFAGLDCNSPEGFVEPGDVCEADHGVAVRMHIAGPNVWHGGGVEKQGMDFDDPVDGDNWGQAKGTERIIEHGIGSSIIGGGPTTTWCVNNLPLGSSGFKPTEFPEYVNERDAVMGWMILRRHPPEPGDRTYGVLCTLLAMKGCLASRGDARPRDADDGHAHLLDGTQGRGDGGEAWRGGTRAGGLCLGADGARVRLVWGLFGEPIFRAAGNGRVGTLGTAGCCARGYSDVTRRHPFAHGVDHALGLALWDASVFLFLRRLVVLLSLLVDPLLCGGCPYQLVSVADVTAWPSSLAGGVTKYGVAHFAVGLGPARHHLPAMRATGSVACPMQASLTGVYYDAMRPSDEPSRDVTEASLVLRGWGQVWSWIALFAVGMDLTIEGLVRFLLSGRRPRETDAAQAKCTRAMARWAAGARRRVTGARSRRRRLSARRRKMRGGYVLLLLGGGSFSDLFHDFFRDTIRVAPWEECDTIIVHGMGWGPHVSHPTRRNALPITRARITGANGLWARAMVVSSLDMRRRVDTGGRASGGVRLHGAGVAPRGFESGGGLSRCGSFIAASLRPYLFADLLDPTTGGLTTRHELPGRVVTEFRIQGPASALELWGDDPPSLPSQVGYGLGSNVEDGGKLGRCLSDLVYLRDGSASASTSPPARVLSLAIPTVTSFAAMRCSAKASPFPPDGASHTQPWPLASCRLRCLTRL